MAENGHASGANASLQPPHEDKLPLTWLESQSGDSQAKFATKKLRELLEAATQPRHASGNACNKLCYFVEQCKSSKSSALSGIAFSEKTCLSLFNFYIDWNERNQHRSMRQVIELLALLIAKNPDPQIKTIVKASILQRSMSIITHQAAQPLVKPAFKALECLLNKNTISTQELINAFRQLTGRAEVESEVVIEFDSIWDSLFSDVFEWMTLADISPAAGKFLVTIFSGLRGNSQGPKNSTASWQRWIRDGLSNQPEALENVKNYLFPPLFKLDRSGSLSFLEDLNTQNSVWNKKDQAFDAQSLLQLAAIEVGKRTGLIGEPANMMEYQKASKKSSATIVLQEDVLSPLLGHASGTVRSLAFSVLISSNSPIRPFSSTALRILQSHVGILYCDTDAKFRNEVLSNTKHMIERLRGATAFLVREVGRISLQVRPQHTISSQDPQVARQALQQTTELLRDHVAFIEWFAEFLLGELIPTASYQRHITALKALSLLLRSGILKQSSEFPSPRASDTVWPCTIVFFNSVSMSLLLDLLVDPFEDVRSTATNILKMASGEDFTAPSLAANSPTKAASPQLASSIWHQESAEYNDLGSECPVNNIAVFSSLRRVEPLGLLKDFTKIVDELSKKTGRADYADGLGHINELLYHFLSSPTEQLALLSQLVLDLEAKVDIAQRDLTRAVLEAPIHATLISLNFVWESINHKDIFRAHLPLIEDDIRTYLDSLQLKLVYLSAAIWDAVKTILCNDSPEGHLPQDLEEGEVIDTKDVLSYSFRAVHESSNLLQTILAKTRLRWESSLSPPPAELFATIGDLTFLQLSTLRHRGAFSTVSQTFQKCCVLTQLEPHIPSSCNRLDLWYQGAIRCMYEQESTTRRSAGIPALITGIMAANATVPSFEQVMEQIMTMAGRPEEATAVDKIQITQVHAMNTLKDIFKDSTQGKKSREYVVPCFELGVKSLQSPIWAIRNCGLILIRSIIDRMFGTSDSKAVMERGWDGKSVKLSYEEFLDLPELLDRVLRSGTNPQMALNQPGRGVIELVFPALEVVRRAGAPQSHLESIYNSVMVHLRDPVWHVREIAAHTICTFLFNTNWTDSVRDLLQTETNSANQRHGVLLAVKYILEKRFQLNPDTAITGVLDYFLPNMRRHALQDAAKFKNFVIVNTHIQLSNVVAKLFLSCSDKSKLNSVQIKYFRETMSKFSGFEWRKGVKLEAILYHFNPDCELTAISSLCYPSLAEFVVYMIAMRNDSGSLLDFIEYVSGEDEDSKTPIAALTSLPEAWKGTEYVPLLCAAYLLAMDVSERGEVGANARANLAKVLDERFSQNSINDRYSEATFKILSGILSTYFSDINSMSRKGLQARIKFGAWVLVAAFNSASNLDPEPLETGLKVWGCWLAFAGTDHSVLDLRLAVASGLASFFRNLDLTRVNDLDSLIPSLLALYNCLNDDDEDIRDHAAKTVSTILEKSLAPPAACQEFLFWLKLQYSLSSQFAWSVLLRITGTASASLLQSDSLKPAKEQFEEALMTDDDLFAEEEQNLYIDAVREVGLWSNLFSEMPLSVAKMKPLRGQKMSLILEFASWVSVAVVELNKTLALAPAWVQDKQRWTHTPPGFTATFRTLRCANVLLNYHSKHFKERLSQVQPEEQHLFQAHKVALDQYVEDIISALQNFRRSAINQRVHVVLLREVEGQKLLNPTSLPRISLRFKHGFSYIQSESQPLLR